MRFVHGVRSRTGLMGIGYPSAAWLYKDCSYKAYTVNSVDDLYNPFASMLEQLTWDGCRNMKEGQC
ncbi:hypothetical protein BRADI_1g38113v3 [Brachypodium distachyon]|uniref:Uncharacterized protein n=1 Tax=Brachypodium distachyon TaxID=15368 RepID=A0A2K2DNG1_BRADI|nr:hypothetical protein BRADI_1g38113v3 [Brachypodium distachyon]